MDSETMHGATIQGLLAVKQTEGERERGRVERKEMAAQRSQIKSNQIDKMSV